MERIISQDFKETEIGSIPKEWEVVRLGDINQSIKSSLIPSDFPDEDFEYYSIPAYQDNKKPTIQKGSSILSLKLVLQNDTLLFGKLNPRVEKVWVVSSESPLRKIGSTEWLPIIPNKDKAISSFLYFLEYSNYVMPKAKELVSGSTPSRQRVDPTSFYKISIPLPPIPEQKAIANVLSTVQENIEKTEAVINSAKELKKSLMNHLFTYGPVPINEAEKVKLKETEVGLIPTEWEVIKLRNLCNKITDGTHKTPAYTSKGIPFLRIKDIQKNSIDWNDTKYISINEHLQLIKRSMPEKGDILLSKNGTIGLTKVIDWDTEFSFFVSLCLLKPKHEIINNYYLSYYLSSSGLEQIKLRGKKMTVTNLHLVEINQILIPLPPLPIQKEIADILSTVNAKIEAEENKAKALEKLFQSLLNDLMTGKIRVREEIA